MSAAAREAALEGALRRCASSFSQSREAPDEELLDALASLCEKEPASKALSAQLGACFGHLGADSPAPKISKLLWRAARADSFGLRPTAAGDPFHEALRRRLAGGLPKGSPILDGALALGAGPWAREIGLLLNEADPQAAARWPWICAMAGGSPSLVNAVQAAAPKPGASLAGPAWIAACATRDPAFLALARACPAPQSASAQECASLLSETQPHAYARRACNIEKRPALERHEVLQALLSSAQSPALTRDMASDMLRAACLAEATVPEGLETAWRKPLVDAGASLSLGAAFEVLERIQQRIEAQSSHSQMFASAQSARKQLLDAELAATRFALTLGSSKRSPEDPPASFLAVEALARASAPSAKLLEAAIDRWARDGFGREALGWRKLAGGHTVSVASAIAGLPRRKAPAPNFEAQIKRWLPALATQGFDFEAKASPKSKSLGERLRSTASLREFWPLVEAQALSMTAKPAPKSARRGL